MEEDSGDEVLKAALRLAKKTVATAKLRKWALTT